MPQLDSVCFIEFALSIGIIYLVSFILFEQTITKLIFANIMSKKLVKLLILNKLNVFSKINKQVSSLVLVKIT